MKQIEEQRMIAEEKSKKEEAAAQSAREALEVKKKLRMKSVAVCFETDWEDGSLVRRISGDEEWTTFVKDLKKLEMPVILTDSTALEACLGEESDKAKALYWVNTFVERTRTRLLGTGKDRSHAPLQTKHNAGPVVSFVSNLLPPEVLIDCQSSPPLASLMLPWIFAYTQTCIASGFDPDSLGSIRIYTKGQAKLLMIAASDLKTLGEGSEKTLTQVAESYFFGNAETCKKVVGKVKHVTIDAVRPTLVMTPLGFFSVAGPLNDKSVGGVRLGMLTKGPKNYKEFEIASSPSFTERATVLKFLAS